MADGEGGGEAEAAEDALWEKLMIRLVALRGDAEVELLIQEKHRELASCAVPLKSRGPRSSADAAAIAEARESWFSRKLRSQGIDPKERRKLCKGLLKALRKHEEKYAEGAQNAISSCEALKEGGAREGPIICHRLAAALVGTRFEGMWVAKEKSGVYELGEKLLVAVQADLEGGELLIHGYFDDSNVLHPVRSPVRAFLEEHGAKPPSDNCDMFGGAAAAAAPAAAAAGHAEELSQDASPSKRARDLPPGWTKRESRSKPGVYYYVHEAKGLSQFERPEE